MRQFSGVRVVVLGLARQGTALARYLAKQEARVTASDVKPADALSEALGALEGLPVRYALGGHPLSLLNECDVLCLSGGVPTDLPIVVEARQRGIPISNDAQIFLERCPALVVGITGSAGKTTTTTLIGEMLKASRLTTWVGGNIGNPLIADLDEISPGGVVVMELSSFQLEVMTSSPRVAAVLNITPNHLDRHLTMEAYIAAKKRILDFQSPSPDSVAVLSCDDPEARKLIGAVRGEARLFSAQGPAPLGEARGAFVRDGKIILRLTASSGRKSEGDEREMCAVRDLKLLGPHNVLNVLAACVLAQAAGANVEAIASVATSFRGVAHRLQLVGEYNGVYYYDDSIATAPERLVAALKSFGHHRTVADGVINMPANGLDGRSIVLLCGGRDKHLPWDEAAAFIAQRVSHLILFGEMAGLVNSAMHRAQSNLQSFDCAQDKPPTLRPCSGQASNPSTALRASLQIHQAGDLEDAVRLAVQVAQPGDVVLLSPGGTSFDAFKDFAERGDKFVEWVRKWVEKQP